MPVMSWASGADWFLFSLLPEELWGAEEQVLTKVQRPGWGSRDGALCQAEEATGPSSSWPPIPSPPITQPGPAGRAPRMFPPPQVQRGPLAPPRHYLLTLALMGPCSLQNEMMAPPTWGL